MSVYVNIFFKENKMNYVLTMILLPQNIIKHDIETYHISSLSNTESHNFFYYTHMFDLFLKFIQRSKYISRHYSKEFYMHTCHICSKFIFHHII